MPRFESGGGSGGNDTRPTNSRTGLDEGDGGGPDMRPDDDDDDPTPEPDSDADGQDSGRGDPGRAGGDAETGLTKGGEDAVDTSEERVKRIVDRARTTVEETVDSLDTDRDLLDEATTGGFLSEEQERDLKRGSKQFESIREKTLSSAPVEAGLAGVNPGIAGERAAIRAGVAPDIEAEVGVPGTEASVNIDTIRGGEGPNERATKSVVRGATDIANLPALAQSAEQTVEAAGAADEALENPEEAAETASVVAGSAAARALGSAASNPLEASGRLVGGAAGGAAASGAGFLGLRRAAQGVRNARVRAAADDSVDFSDLTTEEAVEEGSLPEFDTSPSAATSEAVDEIRTRAADQPEAVTEAVGTDRALFRSETAQLPEDLVAQRGNFELPGLFTSPDVSPLRTDLTSESTAGFSLRLPRPSDVSGRTQRLSAFEGDRIEGAPSSAAESGFAVVDESGDVAGRFGPLEGGAANQLTDEIDGERIPDPETSGAQFLDEEAERGTAFVRPTGDRTTELEAIFPPETEFVRDRQLAVDLPNDETATLDVFRRPRDADGDGRDDVTDIETSTDGAPDSDRQTAGDLFEDAVERRRNSEGPDDVPATPTPVTGGTTPSIFGRSTAAGAGSSVGLGASSGSNGLRGSDGGSGFGGGGTRTTAGGGSSGGSGTTGFGTGGSGGRTTTGGSGSGASGSGASGSSAAGGGATGTGAGSSGATSSPSSGAFGGSGGGSSAGFGGTSGFSGGGGGSGGSFGGSGGSGSGGSPPSVRPSDPDSGRPRFEDDDDDDDIDVFSTMPDSESALFSSGIQSASEALDGEE